MSIEKIISNLIQLEKILPTILSEQAKNFFQDSFANQGFTDKTLVKWQQSRAGKKRGGATLVDSGILRGAIMVTNVNASGFQAGVRADVKYAQQHNEGTKGQVKRQFIGRSERLVKLMQARVNREVRRAIE